jgi:hypothetical protein
LRNERGSITLEAAVTLPLLLFFCAAISWLLLLSRTEAALQEAVDEAVKSTAAHTYPLELLVHAYRNNQTVQDWEQRIEQVLPYGVRALWNERKQRVLPVNGESGERLWSSGAAHRGWTVPYLMEFVDKGKSDTSLLTEESLSINRIALPTFLSEESSYFGIVAEYRVTVPILGMELVLTASAIERCWVGKK